MRSSNRNFLQTSTIWAIEIAVLAVVVGVWFLITHSGAVSPVLLPSPTTVFRAIGNIAKGQATRNDLLLTFSQVAVAMVIVIPLAVGLGMLIGRNPKLRVLDEIANVGMTIPQPIFLPILFIILGSNFFEIVIFGVTHALFVIVVNSAASTRSVPPSYDQLAKLYGTKTFDLYRKIYFPFMVPVILQGIRLGLIFCVAGVMLAEMYAGNGGFGKDILYWGSSFVLPDLLAGIIVVGASTVIINGLFHMLERRGASWRNA